MQELPDERGREHERKPWPRARDVRENRADADLRKQASDYCGPNPEERN
jgi:hypothetical protein